MFALLKQRTIISKATGIEIKPSNIHGRGVFACTGFNPGDIIEEAPLILLSAADKEHLQTTRLYSYYFVINNDETPAALGLGYSSIYNHSPHSNALYMISLRKAMLTIKARHHISPGEEITINYNGAPDDTSAVFFETPTS